MSSAHKAIYSRLSTTSAVTAIVGKNILPEFREDAIPSVTYECDLVEAQRSFEEIVCSEYEVVLSCVANKIADVDALAAVVTAAIDRQDWVGSEVSVMGCWVENKETDTVEVGTRNVRAWVVELKAKLLLKGI